ncbi:16S rRNA (uracil(1498)-N(3))-methyltransferase [Roseomonas sp. SSH11]|uniref:Ribosomal RNA small subunit methyltransferase E n=1 Tax=Pararoseomonas baculiformis TaxID=2820812 RepID=A0ABS4A8Y2_9PROT|nr:16S rRNA (uracil(1498)-N(3))-methyltransferase [Pararoseomonas baculiformis]
MSIPRLYTEHDLAEGEAISAAPGQGRYLGSVMRKKEGDEILLFNGRDGEWKARVTAIRKDDATFTPEERRRAQTIASGPVLLVAALKREAMEWVVEKVTELGVRAIHPVLTTRAVPDRVNRARLFLIAREAAEQCERLDVPEIAEAVPLYNALGAWDGSPLAVAAERRRAVPLAQLPPGPMPALLIGPEGGFTGPELDALARHPFVAMVSLGPRILRAETAAVSALAVLQATRGDWAHQTDE